MAGRIIAGKPVRLACERHLRDLKERKVTGMKWRLAAAQLAIAFFAEMLTIEVRGEVRPFELQPFQKFIVGSIFGWHNADDTRRFRTAYVEIGKGNGKTPLAAGIGLYGLVVDKEASPEIYAAATTREQAQIAFKDAVAMVSRSAELRGIIEERVGSLYRSDNNGIFRPVSSEHRGLDGKRVHMALVDELHEHPNAMVVDKMRAGTKARRNALIFEITNSGFDLESVCRKHHEYSLRILGAHDAAEQIDDPSWFAYVCALDEGDSWLDEAVWPKPNPGLGAILPISYLREQVREAQGMPSKQAIVKRLNFCIWTQQHSIWITLEAWEACNQPVQVEPLQPCWAGVDLSSKLDLTALVLAFRRDDREGEQATDVDLGPEDGEERAENRKSLTLNYSVDLVPFFWIPQEPMHRRAKEDGVPYPLWVEAGLVRATPGTVVDYDRIFEEIVDEIAPKYSIQEIGFDPHNAQQFMNQLQETGFTIVEIPQNVKHLSEPAKLFEALIASKRLRHGGHAVLRWNVQNVAVKEDNNENIFPFKQQKTKRIDGVSAAVMALNRLMLGEVQGASVYESRGVLVF